MLPFAPDFRRLILAFHKLFRDPSRQCERQSSAPGKNTPLVGAPENISEEGSVKRGRKVEPKRKWWSMRSSDPFVARADAHAKAFRPSISLAMPRRGSIRELFFETGGRVSAKTQFDVWERRETRRRLRHCNGIQTPNATVWLANAADGKAGARTNPKSG